jgi:hypothetical protein
MLASKPEDCLLSSTEEKEGFGLEATKFSQYVHTFYDTAIEYLCKWICFHENLQSISWVTLCTM